MAIDYDRLMAWRFDDVRHRYMKRDSMLYALGLGFGSDPTNKDDLKFAFERDLQVLPTFATVLGLPKTWWRETGQVDVTQVVHGEQSLRIHQLPPPDGEVIGQTQITGIVDKGPGRGALLYTTRTIVDAASGAALATLAATSFARGDGGFGGPQGPAKPVHAIPARLPDFAIESPTLPQAALIYRLSGDYNPLHADPEVARAAGYERPILHGLCTFGIAGAVILRVVCASDPKRLRSIDARFSAAVFPGETLRTEVWLDGEIASFRSFVAGREALVLNNGRAEIARVS